MSTYSIELVELIGQLVPSTLSSIRILGIMYIDSHLKEGRKDDRKLRVRRLTADS
jgi:hypothetical protein